jgi:ornithine cyclodeaminase/alanine dehydrogenase-like protein (mu-crystallin family)
LISDKGIFHLAELVSGKRSINTNGTTVFKSVGSALFDIYAAQAFLAEALRLERGTVLHAL